MMLPTHALAGLALATPVAVVAPDLATPALVGALVGGVLPDLDVVAEHRRTLHYPTGYVLLAVPLIVVALVVPGPATVGVAAGVVSAAIHCRMDRYGGSREFRPWEQKSDRGVYDHVKRRWRRAKRWTRYDGSTRDLFVAAVVAVPPLVLLDGPFVVLASAALAVGVVYTALRRRISHIAEVAVRSIRRGAARIRTDCGQR